MNHVVDFEIEVQDFATELVALEVGSTISPAQRNRGIYIANYINRHPEELRSEYYSPESSLLRTIHSHIAEVRANPRDYEKGVDTGLEALEAEVKADRDR